ncbi:sensor histidine kinase [Microbacterium sp. MYb62]|uniref:sensor histidine kinase n=1 Tax=Microbacterium sp. MYb62 TaxID=1848690 RepID=UPI000CFBDB87|nr:histidine kinase [Microbacterium sp. MYb62]PRB09809.1 two-component sensor histidine kinase [Microbacterium sp. MYb62]
MEDLHREKWFRRWPPWMLDALLGVSVAAIVSVTITADIGGRQSPDLLAYLWAVGLGALMLARRNHALVVLAVTALGLFAYYAAGYPAIGLAVPVVAALFSAAEVGKLGASIVTAVVVATVSVGFRLIEGQSVAVVVGYELSGHVILMAAAIAFGDSLRSRRAVHAGAGRIAGLMAAEARRQAEVRLADERLSIARDLHDSFGHSSSVISLYTEVAREAIGRQDSAAARQALDQVASTAGESMVELRRTVSLLRAPGERDSTVASLSDITALRETAQAAGFVVEMRVDIDAARPLPPIVDRTAFRIVQEALTNIVRHSAGAHVAVVIASGLRRLEIVVLDDGAPPPKNTGSDGNGIRGMRERVESLGGEIRAGFESRGFAVRATLPIGGQA